MAPLPHCGTASAHAGGSGGRQGARPAGTKHAVMRREEADHFLPPGTARLAGPPPG